MALDLFATLIEVARCLDSAGVQHALVGGLAVAVHGAPRATTDIDLLVMPEDVERALASVKQLGFVFDALPLEFNDGMKLRRVTRIEHGESITLDFILVDRNLQMPWSSRQRFETETGEALWVVDRPGLIAMKVQAGRAKDLADIERLKELDR